MSRTTRQAPAEGFWEIVDAWAAEVTVDRRVAAWLGSRCRMVARNGPFLDLVDLPEGATPPARPLRSAVGARGLPIRDDEGNRSAVAEAGLTARHVTEARRYRWAGPAFTPVLVEVHTADGEAVVEAWWEDVWASWPTIRLGRHDPANGPRRSPRRDRATAQVRHLMERLQLDE